MCKAQSLKIKTTGNQLQQHIATEKAVQSQERVLNASNTLINIEVGAQILLVALHYLFLYSEWLQKQEMR